VNLWDDSDDAWYVVQSLCLLCIKSETATQRSNQPATVDAPTKDLKTHDIIRRSSFNPRFGRTMGASSSVMLCISQITGIFQQQGHLELSPDKVTIKRTLLALLAGCRPNPWSATKDMDMRGEDTETRKLAAQQLHLCAVTAAALIYYHQCLDERPPRDLAPYVSEVLACMSAFYKANSGNCTMWPIFIAGTEVYREVDIDQCRMLFESTRGTGMRNRVEARNVLEEVWKIRSERSARTGDVPDMISVKWREVISTRKSDFLIV
jgi:hypothetical protein